MSRTNDTKPAPKSTSKQEWWEQGVRFECQGSGRCCVSRGEFGFVYVTLEDRKRMGKLLQISTGEFTRRFTTKTDGVYHIKDAKGPDCLFLKKNRCEVYEARPVQCRTWPFWPEVMGAKTWAKEVKAFCPGVGKGKTVNAQDIRATLAEQTKWEHDLTHGK